MIRAMRLRSPTCKDQNMASGRCCGRCTYAIRGYHTGVGEQDDAPSGLAAGASVFVPTVAVTVRAEARTRPDYCTYPAFLPASARSPREGAVWQPPLAPPKRRL